MQVPHGVSLVSNVAVRRTVCRYRTVSNVAVRRTVCRYRTVSNVAIRRTVCRYRTVSNVAVRRTVCRYPTVSNVAVRRTVCRYRTVSNVAVRRTVCRYRTVSNVAVRRSSFIPWRRFRFVTERRLWSGGSFPTLRMTVVAPSLLVVTFAGTTTVRNVRSHLHKDVQSQPQLTTGHCHTSVVVEPFSVCAKCDGALDKLCCSPFCWSILRPSGESSSRLHFPSTTPQYNSPPHRAYVQTHSQYKCSQSTQLVRKMLYSNNETTCFGL